MLGILFEGIRISAKRFTGAWGLKHAALLFGIVAFSSTGFSEPIQSAADRVFFGDTQGIPLAANANPGTIQTLKAMRQQAANNGTVRVIVGVRAAFAPEGLMSANNVSLQRNEIASAQSAVLNKVASLKQKPEKTKHFETIPFMAVEATPAELEALASLPEITSIEEDRLSKPTLTQSVPLIGGATAWSSGYTGTGQTVAILDTGVDKAHPFLTGKVVSEACYSTIYAPDGATSVCPGGVRQSTAAGSAMPYGGTCPAGECDHGTHVAGIAAGKGAGYSGVAKDASLIAIQVFTRFDSAASCGSATSCVSAYDSDIILGLQRVYALRNTYHIAAVNMSLGGGQYFDQASCAAASASMKSAIDTLRSVNIATVISSGNDGFVDSMGAPGCISSAVSVGATWDSAGSNNRCAGNYLGTSMVDQIACYSNSASFLNLLAPGSLITSSIPNRMYSNYQGTSMAAPHVAGAWALLKQKKAALTVTEGLNALSSTGVSVTDTRNGIVKPRININAALNAIASTCSYTLSSASFSAGSAAAIGNVSVTAAPSCAWIAKSNATWISVTSGASGSGNGSVGYSIAANTAASRTGTMTIAGKTFTVTQNGTGTLPSAPIIGTATAGNASVRVTFTPGVIGSGTLLNYTAMCGTITGTGTSSPITVGGLTNGTAYTCKVRTTSTVGIGTWSALSNTVTPSAPLALPAAPTIGTATAGNASARVAFTPGVIGGGTLLNYTAMCGTTTTTGISSPITVSGLTNGTAYTCKVRTTSSAGISPWSAVSNSVVPSASLALPSAPTIGTATAGNASAKVAFTPGAIGSGTLVNYTAMCGAIAATGTSSPITVSPLTNGTAYTCKVRTTSTVGIGPWSALSNSVTPDASIAAGISAGAGHSCALTSGGGMKCWGDNRYGQLGDNSITKRLTPVNVSGLTSGVRAIASGDWHNCALTSGGGVKCWGNNYYGQLGDNSATDRHTPVNVSGLTNGVRAIAAGYSHTCALTSGGGVKCWGYNGYGQLGDGSTTNRLTPVNVSGLTSVIAIAAGTYHTCALTSGGGVKCWGNNLYGQLGDNSIMTRLTPVNVSGMTSGVIAIATGDYGSCALTSAGGVKCWGYNLYGQLGDNSATDRHTPVNVSGLTSGVIAIVGGTYHTCALTSGGGVKCWGKNSYGQLGDNSTTQRLTPVNVSGLTSGMSAIAAGWDHTCTLTRAGGAKCWGNNLSGQLGDNSTTQRLTPVNVVGLTL